ncbi:glyceraldehyde 3-phosphate dehydrogenase NAD-binding domain-containing protein [Wenzhouxiangella sp. XN24]|uniref:type I glyceraldehyde-3-phosphate dehydrogenase n=1 Tax=Wenzhouxiangella sp. XN24 TaxID=2713569 RepID=UPI0013ED5385|nr:glyceraldehyde 3-phosphate dehydrogenase NAD-binding domain-containing protein [Wenzhouxiangella sp. XN24]NGX15331.1 type I glyceraldehyde-3-phosphate dehydrogenase [Wenzhouxiangella sp. XN24]
MSTVAINGLGRIGRATLKILMKTPGLELVAVNDLADLPNLAYLLRYDTVYGRYEESVSLDDGRLVVGDRTIEVLAEKSPADLPWKRLGIDVVFECTGAFRHRDELQGHIDAGARHVILSAPAKDDDLLSLVHGVTPIPDPLPAIMSTASCTTNCIAPVAEVMERRIGVHKALMTTVHAYTSSQGIVDGPSGRWERGRAGAANLVPTSTGAAKATARVLPHYDEVFDGMAIRAPIPVGSIADMCFVTRRSTSADEINGIFREEAGEERYQDVLGCAEDPMVSSDIIADPRASVVDLSQTRVVAGDLVKILSWYDNEWGYASQMVRQARAILAGRS